MKRIFQNQIDVKISRKTLAEKIKNGVPVSTPPTLAAKIENEDEDKEDEKDWFLEAFLVGYRKEKDRRRRLRAASEEKEKKAMNRKKLEDEMRKEEKEKFEEEIVGKLNNIKETLDTLKGEERKLRLEIEELRREVKEERPVKVIVEIKNGVGRIQGVSGPQVNDSYMNQEVKDVTLVQQDNTQHKTKHMKQEVRM